MANFYTLSEMAPYIQGKKFEGAAKREPDKNAVDQFAKRVGESITAKSNLDLIENWNDFYSIEPDFKNWIKADQRAEAFYAAKNEAFAYAVPSMCIYMLKKAYNVYKSPNLIFKMLPQPMFEKFIAEGYLGGGLSLQDVVCSFCNPNYQPLSTERLKCRCGEFTEIYVQETDMVALVPNRVADNLDDKAIDNITVTPAGLSTGGMLLRMMGGSRGVINSTYDLRNLV